MIYSLALRIAQDKVTPRFFVSISSLREYFGWGRGTIVAAIAELTHLGFFVLDRRGYGGRGLPNFASSYRVFRHKEWSKGFPVEKCRETGSEPEPVLAEKTGSDFDKTGSEPEPYAPTDVPTDVPRERGRENQNQLSPSFHKDSDRNNASAQPTVPGNGKAGSITTTDSGGITDSTYPAVRNTDSCPENGQTEWLVHELEAIVIEKELANTARTSAAMRAWLKQGVPASIVRRAICEVARNMPETERNPGLYLQQNLDGAVRAVERYDAKRKRIEENVKINEARRAAEDAKWRAEKEAEEAKLYVKDEDEAYEWIEPKSQETE